MGQSTFHGRFGDDLHILIEKYVLVRSYFYNSRVKNEFLFKNISIETQLKVKGPKSRNIGMISVVSKTLKVLISALIRVFDIRLLANDLLLTSSIKYSGKPTPLTHWEFSRYKNWRFHSSPSKAKMRAFFSILMIVSEAFLVSHGDHQKTVIPKTDAHSGKYLSA